MKDRARKLGLLLGLYFCQGLPGGFLAVALPVILRRQGADLTTVGLAGMLSLPWMLKVLWAPLVDRWGSRKSWLIPSQLGMLAVTAGLAAHEPESGLSMVVLLFLVLNVFAATQDIAADGIAVDILEDDELGPGNSAQISGFKLGNLFGGGVLLALIGTIGWAGDFVVMAGCIAVVLMVVSRWQEPPRPERDAPSVKVVMGRLWRALRRQGAGFIAFIVFAKFGETFGGAMIKPMLSDAGLSSALIGTIDGIGGGLSTIAGAALGGLLATRSGWRRTLAFGAVGQGLSLVGVGLLSAAVVTPLRYLPFAITENFFGGITGVAIFSMVMGARDRAVGASQFTAAQVLYMSGGALAYPLAGAIADRTDYLPVMVTGGVLTLALAVVAFGWARRLDVDVTADPGDGTRSG